MVTSAIAVVNIQPAGLTQTHSPRSYAPTAPSWKFDKFCRIGLRRLSQFSPSSSLRQLRTKRPFAAIRYLLIGRALVLRASFFESNVFQKIK
jgi:hypothetical protein